MANKHVVTEVVTRQPSECSSQEIRQFRILLLKSREVTQVGVHNRILRASQLSWATSDTQMVAIAALKVPYKQYKRSVFEKAKKIHKQDLYPLEFGWMFVMEPFRRQGIAKRLLEALLASIDSVNVFATSRELNDPIVPLLKHSGFEKFGDSFPSARDEYNIVLWIRNA